MQHTTVPPVQHRTRAVPNRRWRVVDIVVASVVGVALGVVFFVWGFAYSGLETPLKGWMGHAEPMLMGPGYAPASGARATPPHGWGSGTSSSDNPR